MKRRVLFSLMLFVPLLVLNLACDAGDPNYSGNFQSQINVTGNYRVDSTPNGAKSSYTFTQTGNLVQGIDNQGVVYEGSATGDIKSLNTSQGKQYVTVAITLQGRDAAGVTYTLLLTQAALQFLLGLSNTVINTQPDLQTNDNNPYAVIGLIGTYTDSTGRSGLIEMHNNTPQYDETITA
jgi:hypothetical protein